MHVCAHHSVQSIISQIFHCMVLSNIIWNKLYLHKSFFLPFAATLDDPGKAWRCFLMGFCHGAFQLQSLDKLLELQYIIAAWMVCKISLLYHAPPALPVLYFTDLKEGTVWSSLSEPLIRALTLCLQLHNHAGPWKPIDKTLRGKWTLWQMQFFFNRNLTAKFKNEVHWLTHSVKSFWVYSEWLDRLSSQGLGSPSMSDLAGCWGKVNDC